MAQLGKCKKITLCCSRKRRRAYPIHNSNWISYPTCLSINRLFTCDLVPLRHTLGIHVNLSWSRRFILECKQTKFVFEWYQTCILYNITFTIKRQPWNTFFQALLAAIVPLLYQRYSSSSSSMIRLVSKNWRVGIRNASRKSHTTHPSPNLKLLSHSRPRGRQTSVHSPEFFCLESVALRAKARINTPSC